MKSGENTATEAAVALPSVTFTEKKIHHGRNYVNHCFGFGVAGCFAHMAP